MKKEIKEDMRLAIAQGPTSHWLFRSHVSPSKFSAIASHMCGRRNRAVKHMHVRLWLINNCWELSYSNKRSVGLHEDQPSVWMSVYVLECALWVSWVCTWVCIVCTTRCVLGVHWVCTWMCTVGIMCAWVYWRTMSVCCAYTGCAHGCVVCVCS